LERSSLVHLPEARPTPGLPNVAPGGTRAVPLRGTTMSSTTPWPAPQALLLDFGGVIMLTTKPDGGRQAAVARVAERLARSGHHLPTEELAQSLQAGRTALKLRKSAASRRRAPRELSRAGVGGGCVGAALRGGG